MIWAANLNHASFMVEIYSKERREYCFSYCDRVSALCFLFFFSFATYFNMIMYSSIHLALWRYHQEWPKVHLLVRLEQLFLVHQLVLNVVLLWGAASIVYGKP